MTVIFLTYNDEMEVNVKTSYNLHYRRNFSFRKLTGLPRWVAILTTLTLVFIGAACGPLVPIEERTPSAVEITDTPKIIPNTPAPQVILNTPVPGDQIYGWNRSSLSLKTSLPESAAEASVYLVTPDKPATIASVKALANLFGIKGEVYLAPPDQLRGASNVFMVTDGGPRLYVSSDNYFSYYTHYGMENYSGGNISDEYARTVIDDFMTSHNFKFEYQVERASPNKGKFYIVSLLDGKQLRYNNQMPAGLEIELNDEGQVFSVYGALSSGELVGQYPIRSAGEAFQFMLNTQAGTLQSLQSDNRYELTVRQRTYPDNQRTSIYGYVSTQSSTKTEIPPFLSIAEYPISGNTAGLEKIAPNKLVVAIGQFRSIKSIRQFMVEEWKISGATPVMVQGNLHLKNNKLIITDVNYKDNYFLTNFPNDISQNILEINAEPVISGFLLSDGSFEWKTVQYYPSGSQSNNRRGAPWLGYNNLYELNFTGETIPLPTPYPTPIPLSTTEAGEVLYIVQPGDTFDSIAQKFNISSWALMQANGISDLSSIWPGVGLNIPSTSTLKNIQRLRGIVQVNILQFSDGTQQMEYTFLANNAEYAHSTMVLEGASLQDLRKYHNRPVDIWGIISHTDIYGRWIVNVERHEIPFPDLNFQILKGTQTFANIDGQSIVIFTDEDDVSYVQLSLNGEFNGFVTGPNGHQLPVIIEGLAIPNETFGGFPTLRIFNVSPDTGESSNIKVTADQPNIVAGQMVNQQASPDITIEKAELVYFVVDPRSGTLAMSNYIQPMWRFTGHHRNGALIEILVQALKDEFLSPELQIIGRP